MKTKITEIEPRIIVQESRAEGIMHYDIDDNYPNRVRDIIAASVMGTSCVKLYKKFIYGRGFSNIKFAKTKINRKGLTPDKLLSLLKEDMGDIGSFYIHININAAYEITEANYMPMSHVRFVSPDDKDHSNMYSVSKKHGSGETLRKEDVDFIEKYTDNPVDIDAQVARAGGWDKYKGQLYFYSNRHDQYSLAVCDPALEDIMTDSENKLYKLNNVKNNFNATHLLIIDPMESGGTGEEDGTERDTYEDEEKSGLVKDLEKHQGAKNASKIAVIEKTHPDQKISLEKVEQQNGDRLYEFTESSVQNNIRKCYWIPPVLIQELASGIAPTADQMIDATKTYNSTTADERLIFEEAFRVIFTRWHDKSINPDADYTVMPCETISKDDGQRKKDKQEVLGNDKLTPDQKIMILIADYQMGEDEAQKLVNPADAINNAQTLAGTLGVGGTTSLVDLVSNEKITPETKRGLMEVLFSIPQDDINKIIPPPTPTP